MCNVQRQTNMSSCTHLPEPLESWQREVVIVGEPELETLEEGSRGDQVSGELFKRPNMPFCLLTQGHG